MHKWAESILECVKTKVESIGIENFEGQNLDDLKDWTEIAKNIVCFDKDFKIVEAMKKSEENDEIMEMIERYEDYPERRYYDDYRYKNGRFAPKGRGMRRGYEEPPYWHMTPEMYHDWVDGRDMDRDRRGRMYYSEPSHISDSAMRDSREGRSGMSRKMYMESKEIHRANTPQDKEAKMRDLEKYMKDLSEDVTDMIGDMTPEERSMIKAKMSTLVSKM